MNFGHSALNCHLKARCVRCGDEHSSKICSLINKNASDNNKIPEEFLKCAKCDGNHSAKFLQCPKRAEYIKVGYQLIKLNSKLSVQ